MNPFKDEPWFVQEPLEPEEEEEAMNYEKDIFIKTRVTKGANPLARTTMLEVQRNKEGEIIPESVKKPEKMLKQIKEAYEYLVETSAEQAQIMKNINNTLERKKQEKERKKIRALINTLDLEQGELSDPYTGDTPHLSEDSDPESDLESEQPEQECDEVHNLFNCCNFDQFDELSIATLYVDDEEQIPYKSLPDMEHLKESLFQDFYKGVGYTQFLEEREQELEETRRTEYQTKRHSGFWDLPEEENQQKHQHHPQRNREEDFQDEYLWPDEEDFQEFPFQPYPDVVQEEAPVYNNQKREVRNQRTAGYDQDVPKERGPSLRKDLEKLQAKHPRFFPEDLSDSGDDGEISMIPTIKERKQENHGKNKSKTSKTKQFMEEMRKERLRRRDLTSQERMALFFRDRYPIPSGLPTNQSISNPPVIPNPLMSQLPWSVLTKYTGKFIQTDVDIYMLKRHFITFPRSIILLSFVFLFLLFMGTLFELHPTLLAILAGLAMICLYHLGGDVYTRVESFKKEKEDRIYRLKNDKPIIKSLGLPPRVKENRKPQYPPEIDPSMYRECNMIAEEDQNDFGSVISTTPVLQEPVTVPRKKKQLPRLRPKISEALVSLIDERPFLPIMLDDGSKHIALLDSGSTSCAIKPEVLAKLEETMAIPRITKEYRLTGVIKGVSSKGTEVAFITITLNKGYVVRNIPMIVADCGADLLIGANLIKSHRWANYWEDDKYYIDIGKTGRLTEYDGEGRRRKKEPIQAYFLPKSVLKGVTMCNLILEPGESRLVPLRIPQLEELKDTNLHHSDLIAMDLEDKDLKAHGLRVVPCVTRITRKKEIMVELSNKTSLPVYHEKGLEVARIQMFKVNETGKDPNVANMTTLLQMKHIFDQIPRIHPIPDECYCRAGEHDAPRVFIQLSDRYGLTSSGDNLVTTIPRIGDTSEITPMTPLKPGLTIRKHFKDDRTKEEGPFYSILVVPDDTGEYETITKRKMEQVKETIKDYYKDRKFAPIFLFLDPLVDISYHSMKIITEMFLVFDFDMLPVRHVTGHQECVHFSMRQFPPEIITGTHITRLHIQGGLCAPPPEIRRKDKGSPVFKTTVMGATLFMFKDGIFLNCHLHIPKGSDNTNYGINWKERMFYSLMSELRRLRVPTEFHITVDGVLKEPELGYMTDGFMKVLKDTTSKLPPFLAHNQRCDFPTREVESEELILLSPACACDICSTPTNLLTEEGCFEIFKGDISRITQPKRSHTYRDPALAMIASFSAVDEAEYDIPLDPLGLVDEESLYKFMNTHPGFEDEETEEETKAHEERAKKPPPVLTDEPIRLIERNPPPGIPDTFVPGNWRDFINVNNIEADDHIKKKVEMLLDRYTNILSCRKTDCRPIYIDGKPVEVDVDLSTDKPIFIKPYPVADRMTKVLDAKIDEMLDKDEIVEVDSPYNIPILLTHHNSENKHIAFEDRKFRLCLDLRCINSLIKLKNKHSHLVKGIEYLYGRVQGCVCFTVADMTKAYRSLPAAWHLRQICAFRTPDSTKYPFQVWAFRSTPDGLAILPGFYSLCLQKCLSPRSRACVIQHIDDLLIASKSPEEHLEDIESVFSDLLKGNFLVSVPKLKLFKKEVNFLGHVLTGETLDIPKERKSYFDALKPPTTKKEMQSLLGIAGYMAHFMDSYHLKTGPLFESLKGKNDKQSFTLNEEQMLAFEELKQSVKAAEKLHIVDFDKPIYMEVDASLTGVGSILYQEYNDPADPVGSRPKRHIIRYGSKRFTMTESLHHTSLEREAMAILIGCKQHFYYLSNCVEAIIKTDLKSLITLLSCYMNPDSPRFSRISHRLYSLPFKWCLIHVAGADLPLADALSRLYPPYRCAFSDRHLRYPDLKREYIQLPEEWKKTPNLVLKTADIIKAMRDKILFVDVLSTGVRRKRLDSLVNEINILKDNLGSQYDTLSEQVHGELKHIELSAKEHQQQEQLKPKTAKGRKIAKKDGEDEDTGEIEISAMEAQKRMSSVSAKVLITPTFISKHQNEDPKLSSIILHLKTTPKGQLKVKLIKTYRLLNDTILCTRKNKRLPFDAPGNLRIVCSAKMTLIIMSILHIMGGHYGINTLARLFALTYKTKGSITGFAKIVALGCRACRLHRPTNKRNIPMGRIPIPSEPNHTWHMDHVIWKKESAVIKGKRYEGALNIVDLYSNLLISHLVPDVKAETTIECLKKTFSIMPAPLKIVSDNATGLCANLQVALFLKSKGVQNVATITPYNSKGNKTERMNKILRETLQLVRETFRRKSPYEMYNTVIEMINSRPLSLTNHPHIRQMVKDNQDVVTPFSLHYGQKPQTGPLVALEDELDPQTKNNYKIKWQGILSEHDRLLQEELNERNKLFNQKEGIQVGDLVLKINRGDHQHKENIKYTRNLYEVLEIQKSKFTIRPLFTSTTGIIKVNGQDLKPYNYSELFELLPPDIRELMGESLKPEDLKNQATNDISKVPKDFQNWGLVRIPPGMKLRNKLTPSSLASVPAITLSNSNTITETRTTLSFSSDDDYSRRSPESSISSIRSISEIVIPRFRNRAQGFLHETATPQKPILKNPIQSPRPKGPYSLEGTDSQPSLRVEAPQLKTTETGISLVPRRFMNYLPAPSKAFPLGHMKPIPPPGASQRKKHRNITQKTLPINAPEAEENDPIMVIETTPLPFKHRDDQFTTSTPVPSENSSSEKSEPASKPVDTLISQKIDQLQTNEGVEHSLPIQGCLTRSEQGSLDQGEINKQNKENTPFEVSIEVHSNPDGSGPDIQTTNRPENQDKSFENSLASTGSLLNSPPIIRGVSSQNLFNDWDYSDMGLKLEDTEGSQQQEKSSDSLILVSPSKPIFSPSKEIPSQLTTSNIMDTSPPPDWDNLSSLEDHSKDKKPLNTKDLYKITADISESSEEPPSRHYAGEENLDPTLPDEIQEEINLFNPRKASFADHQGLPLAIDNEGNKWLLARNYEKDPQTTPKHIPFSNPSSPTNEDVVLQTQKEEPDQQQIKTRTGRIVRKPERLIEKDTPTKEKTNLTKKQNTLVSNDTFEKDKTGLSPTPISRLTGFPWFKKTPEPQLMKKLSGIEHPNFKTPVYSRFDPSRLKRVLTKPNPASKTILDPPTPQGDRDDASKPDPAKTRAKTTKNPKISPLGPIGLLRMPVGPSPAQQANPPIPDDIQLGGDSPPTLRRSTRARKPPTRYGFED